MGKEGWFSSNRFGMGFIYIYIKVGSIEKYLVELLLCAGFGKRSDEF